MQRRHQHIRASSRRTQKTVLSRALAVPPSSVLAVPPSSVLVPIAVQPSADEILANAHVNLSQALKESDAAEAGTRKVVAERLCEMLRIGDWKRFVRDYTGHYWGQGSTYELITSKLFTVIPDYAQSYSQILDCGVDLEVAAVAVQRFRTSNYASVCQRVLTAVRDGIATKSLRIGDYNRLRRASEDQRYTLVYFAVMERENEDPGIVLSTLKKSLEIVEHIERKVERMKRASVACYRTASSDNLQRFFEEYQHLTLSEFSLPSELESFSYLSDDSQQVHEYITTTWVDSAPINARLQQLFASFQAELTPQECEKRVFPISLTALVHHLSIQDYYQPLSDAEKLALIDQEIVRLSFPELLLFVKQSAFPSEEKSLYYQSWVSTHSESLEDVVKAQLLDNRTGLIVAFSHDQEDPVIRKIPLKRHDVSDFPTTETLRRSIEKFLVAKETRLYLLSLSLDSTEHTSCETAKTVIEEVASTAIPMGKVICLVVWTTRANEELLTVQWAKEWKVAVFESFAGELSFLQVADRVEDWLDLSTKDLVLSGQYFKLRDILWRPVGKYPFAATREELGADRDAVTAKIVQNGEIMESLCDKLIENFHRLSGDWQRLLLTSPDCLQKPNISTSIPLALEEIVFTSLHQILSTMESLSAIVSLQSEVESKVVMEVWLKTFTFLDLTVEHPKRPECGPLKTPFILLDYYYLVLPYFQHKNYEQFKAEFRQKSVVGRTFDPYPQLTNLYIHDLGEILLPRSQYKSAGIEVFLAISSHKESLEDKLKRVLKYREKVALLCGDLEEGDRKNLRDLFFARVEKMTEPTERKRVSDLVNQFELEINDLRNRKLYSLTKTRLLSYNCVTGQVASNQLTISEETTQQVLTLLENRSLLATGGIIKRLFASTVLCMKNAAFISLSGEVERTGDMLAARSYHGAAATGEAVYVFGGWSGLSELRKTEEFSLVSREWRDLPLMNEARSHFNPCQVGGLFYLAGGSATSIETFSPAESVFTLVGVVVPEAAPCIAVAEDRGVLVVSMNFLSKYQILSNHSLNLIESRPHSPLNAYSGCSVVWLLGRVYYQDLEENKVICVDQNSGAVLETRKLKA